MRLSQILNPPILNDIEKRITEECVEFLVQSSGLPLCKIVTKRNGDHIKLKVRKKKYKEKYNSAFNEAFSIDCLYERALFLNSTNLKDEDSFYIFPIDGYKVIFSEGISDSTFQYQQAFSILMENFGDAGIDTFSELMKYTYTEGSLVNGIKSGAELIFYDVPYCYGVRTNSIEYAKLYDRLR